jgi:hypothetical protein
MIPAKPVVAREPAAALKASVCTLQPRQTSGRPLLRHKIQLGVGLFPDERLPASEAALAMSSVWPVHPDCEVVGGRPQRITANNPTQLNTGC